MIKVRKENVALFCQERWLVWISSINTGMRLSLKLSPVNLLEILKTKKQTHTLVPMVWAVTTAKDDFILKEEHKRMRTTSLHSVLWLNFRGIKVKTSFCTLPWTPIMFFLWKARNVTLDFHSPPSCVFLLPRDEKVHWFFGLEHLSGAVGPGDGSQPVHVISGVQGCAGEADRTTLSDTSLKHITHFTVEVRVRGQPVEDQVMDALDRVSDKKRIKKM